MSTMIDHGSSGPPTRRGGDRGSGLVVAITSMFAFTFLGLVWLARDVDRAISNETAAQSIAFQSARAAAQSAAIPDLRSGEIVIDPQRARGAAIAAAGRLFASYGVEGRVVRIDLDRDRPRVTVEVTIADGTTSVSGVGIVTAERTE